MATGYESLPGLPGVTFNIERIDGIDLTTNAGWAALADINASDLNGHTAIPAGSVTTNASGDAVFNSGGVGVFRVTVKCPEFCS